MFWSNKFIFFFFFFNQFSKSVLYTHCIVLVTCFDEITVNGWSGINDHTLPAKICLALKVIHHPLYSMNNFVINKSKLPQDGVQVFSYMG